jgi:hypothetical protein
VAAPERDPQPARGEEWVLPPQPSRTPRTPATRFTSFGKSCFCAEKSRCRESHEARIGLSKPVFSACRTIHAERREPSVGRETEPTSGDGDCPGGNPRARRRPTDMEAGAGCRGGADGRTRIRSHSISVRYHALGEERWGARRRASGHGRRGGQARRRDATRDAAACGSSDGGAGKHGRDVRRTIARCAGGRQQHGAGRGQLLNTEY